MCSKDSDSRRLSDLEKKEKDLQSRGKHLPQEEQDELQTLRVVCKGKPKRNTKQKKQQPIRRAH